jgi:integrative and conjugative element protein (TIGR02256 family)
MAARRTPTSRLPDLRVVTRVVMTTTALTALARCAGASADGRETGGIVLGHDGGLGGDIHVRHCGDAGPAAVRRPNRFSRDVAHAQRLADAAAVADGSAWIGEWHTHLVDLPTPSETDLRTYRRLLDDPDTGLTRMLAIIVLPDAEAGWQRPAVSAWSFTGTVLRRLPVVPDPSETGP